MRLTSRFHVNRARITPKDLAWMRRFQRELVSAVASVACLSVAARGDPLLAEYLSAGDVLEGLRLFEPSDHVRLSFDFRPGVIRPRTWSQDQAQMARDICLIGDWAGWGPSRWPVKVHMYVFRPHTFTRSIAGALTAIETRLALPRPVNELCVTLFRRIRDHVWFRRSNDFITHGAYPLLWLVRSALGLHFTVGEVRGAIERSVAFEVERVDPMFGVQDPDLSDQPDWKMYVRLSSVEVEDDNTLSQSDADIDVHQW